MCTSIPDLVQVDCATPRAMNQKYLRFPLGNLKIDFVPKKPGAFILITGGNNQFLKYRARPQQSPTELNGPPSQRDHLMQVTQPITVPRC